MRKEGPPPARPWYNLVISEIALRGWSKTELSERSAVARTTIDNWSTNPRTPTAKAVNRVADALGIDRARAHALAGITAPATAAPPDGYPHIPPEVEQYVRRRWRRDPQEMTEILADLDAAFRPHPHQEQPPGEDVPRRRAV